MKTKVLYYLYDKKGKLIFASRDLFFIQTKISELNLLRSQEYLALKKYGYIWFGGRVIFDNCEIIKREYDLG